MSSDQFCYLKSFTYYLVNWFCNENQIELLEFNKKNDIDRIKFIKLLFLVSAVRGKDSFLLSQFSNYSALPYGPVEDDVYKFIKTTNTDLFRFNPYSLELIDLYLFKSLQNDSISKDFEALKSINHDLIKYSSFELVKISQKWSSWQFSYSIAKSKSISSFPMNEESIITDLKFFG